MPDVLMVVEDEPTIRALIVEVLLESGFEVIEAKSGSEAVLLLTDRGIIPDLLMTDVHMPGGVSGIELSAWVRTKRPDIPVVYATGRPDVVRSHGRLGPRDFLLMKPFGPMDAVRAVRRLLDTRT